MYKRLYYLGFVAYGVMLMLALLFYKERTVLSDVSYLLFYMVKDCSFAFQHYRFGEVFTQTFPVLACKAGLSLKAVMLWYSASFIIFYFACYLVCGLFEEYGIALVLLLTQLMLTTETFYYEVSQLLQGISFLLVVIAYVRKATWEPASIGKWVLGGSLIAFSVFFHPLIIIVLIYVLLFFAIDNTDIGGRRVSVGIAALFIGGLILKSILLRSNYEGHSLGGLKNFVKLFPDYFSVYSHKRFLENCLTRYYWVPIIFLIVVARYVINRHWKKLLSFAAAFTGYLFLVNICYPDRATPSFYVENLYIPLALVLSLPLVFDVLPAIRNVRYTVALFAAVLVSCSVRIYVAHHFFKDRLSFERNMLAQYGHRKVIISAGRANMALLQMTWGTPYEFWLLSTLETGRTASIIIDEEPHKRDWAGALTKSMLVNWNVFPYSQLPSRYFHFTDTTTGYVIVE